MNQIDRIDRTDGGRKRFLTPFSFPQNPTQLPLNGRRIVQVKQAGAGEAQDRFSGSAKQQG
jgi:hypothetical protein